jgi:hypothetical protein
MMVPAVLPLARYRIVGQALDKRYKVMKQAELRLYVEKVLLIYETKVFVPLTSGCLKEEKNGV